MILIGLRDTEISCRSTIEPIISIQAKECRIQKIIRNTGFAGFHAGIIEPLVGIRHAILADHPEEFLAAVIECQGKIDRCDILRNRLYRCILDLFDEIFVVICGETLALILLQEIIISEELEACGRHRRDLRTRGVWGNEIFTPPEFLERAEVHNKTNRMRLKCDERQRGSYRVTKPEPQGDR